MGYKHLNPYQEAKAIECFSFQLWDINSQKVLVWLVLHYGFSFQLWDINVKFGKP